MAEEPSTADQVEVEEVIELESGIPTADSFEEYLGYVESIIYGAPSATRVYNLSERLKSWIKTESLPIEKYVAQILKLVFSTQKILFRDRDSRIAVEDVLIELAKRCKQQTLAFFSRALQRQTNLVAKRGSSDSYQFWVLFRWSCCVVLGASEVFTKSEDTNSYIQNQIALLAAISEARNRHAVTSAVAFLQRIFHSVSGSFDVYAKALFSIEEPTIDVSFVAGALLSFTEEKTHSELFTQSKTQFLQLAVKVLLLTKRVPTHRHAVEFKPLFAKLSLAEFQEHAASAISRALKRNGEVAVAAMAEIVPLLTIDASFLLPELVLPTVIENLKSETAEKRDVALHLLRSVLPKCTDDKLVKESALKLRDVLTGSTGTLQFPYQRAAVAEAVAAFVTANVQADTKQAIVDAVVPVLLDLSAKEASTEVLATQMVQIGELISKVSTIPAAALKEFAARLKEKDDAKKRPLLDAISRAFATPAHFAQGGDLVAPLVALAKAVAAKPTTPALGIASLSILARWAAIDPAVYAKIGDAVNPTLVVNSYIFTSVDRLAEDDAIALIRLLVLVPQFKKEGLNNVVGDALLRMLLHSNWKIRRAAYDSLNEVHKTDNGFFADLLSELLLFGHGGQPALLDTLTPEQSAIATHAVISAFGDSPPDNLLPRGLLLSHHPVVSCGAEHVWEKLLHRFGGDAHAIRTVRAHAQDAAILVASPRILLATPIRRQMALAAAVALAATAGENGVAALLEASKSLLDESLLKSLTKQDLVIYNTPAGVVVEQPDEGVYVPQVIESTVVKRSKAEAKLYTAEDDREAREKAKAKAEQLAQEKKEASIKAQLAKEDLVRQKVVKVYQTIDAGLRLVAATCEGYPAALHARVATLIPALTPFISNPLFTQHGPVRTALSETAAVHVALSLTACISPSLRPYSSLLARCMVAVLALRGAHAKPPADVVAIVLKTMDKLGEACTLPQPSATFALMLPVLRCVLEMNPSNQAFVAAQNKALHIVALHTAPSVAVPRDSMCYTLIRVLSSGAVQLHAAAQDALIGVCAGSTNLDDLKGVFEEGLLSPLDHVRNASLDALTSVPVINEGKCPKDAFISTRLWLARTDPEPNNAPLSDALWEMYGHGLDPAFVDLLPPLLSHPQEIVRECAAAALAAGLREISMPAGPVLQKLFTLYTDASPAVVAATKTKGESKEKRDPGVQTRMGVAVTFGAMSGENIISEDEVVKLLDFMVSNCVADLSSEVRQAMVEAGVEVINGHSGAISKIMPLLESKISDPDPKIKEGVVVFLGAVGRHLPHGSPKVSEIVDSLFDALEASTPQVQNAVANCLQPLMPAVSDRAPKMIDALFEKLINSKKAPSRRGAAAGLAGVVKGLGLSSLKTFSVAERIRGLLEHKDSSSARAGGLLVMEQMTTKMGRLFEPYVIVFLPMLLTSYGDASAEVRDATSAAARSIMGALSDHGVKLILPALLRALDDEQWRTKQGSAQLLGAMSFCAPKQLSACLPAVVPKLSDVLMDSHPKVREAAATSLKQVGSVIRNPEIMSLVPVMLAAIGDSTQIKNALDSLMNTSFVHEIDAASLALIVPTLCKALKDRSIEIKKRGSQVAGNLCELAGHKELAPYLSVLVPMLKQVLLDPIPEVRTSSAKALGSLVHGLGEKHFPDLIQWLLDTLRTDASSVERTGAAQGLSEVLAGLEISRLDDILPVLTAGMDSQEAHVREGVLGLFIYLPPCLGDNLNPYLGRILPGILAGLADESEAVRDVALRSSRMIIARYAVSSLELLLPALQDSLFNSNWRIRQSSVQLVGELLYHVATKAHENRTEEQQEEEAGMPTVGTDAQMRAVMNALGQERRAEVLASLYIVRLDISTVVRSIALQVWKSLVVNTPRTLKEVMPALMRRVIKLLSSSESDHQEVASRALGEVVKKLGDRMLADILPMLASGLDATDKAQRRGVTMGLAEAIDAAGKVLIGQETDNIIPIVRRALCDEAEEVREAGSQAFAMLHRQIGTRAIDDVVPDLLNELGKRAHAEDTESINHPLEALKAILAVRSHVVLPYLIPKLMAPPITAFRANALASLAEVAGQSLHFHLNALLPALIDAMNSSDAETASAATTAARNIALSLPAEYLHVLMSELNKAMSSKEAHVRRGALIVAEAVCANSKIPLEGHVGTLIQDTIQQLDDNDDTVVTAAMGALEAILLKALKKDDLPSFVDWVRNCMSGTMSHSRNQVMRGLQQTKTLASIIPVFAQGLIAGTPEVRESAALGLGELSKYSTPEAMKSHLLSIAGQLIRVIGERLHWKVKAAILHTCGQLLDRSGPALKPFVPQLQTTFIKNLSDPTAMIRRRAAEGLAKLVQLKPRMDAIVTELTGQFKTADPSVHGGLILALRGLFEQGGDLISQTARDVCLPVLQDFTENDDESIVEEAGAALGAFCKHADEKTIASILPQLLSPHSDAAIRRGRANALKHIFTQAGNHLPEPLTAVVETLKALVRDEQEFVRIAAVQAVAALVPHAPNDNKMLVSLLADRSGEDGDVRLHAMTAIKDIAKLNPALLKSNLKEVVAVLMNNSKERMTPVRLGAERALYHTLQIRTGEAGVREYLDLVDPATGKNVVEYCKKTLTKLPVDSDTE